MSELLSILATEQGLAFGMLVVFVAVAWWLGKQLLAEKDGRRQDVLDLFERSVEESQRNREVIEALTRKIQGGA